MNQEPNRQSNTGHSKIPPFSDQQSFNDTIESFKKSGEKRFDGHFCERIGTKNYVNE